MKIWLDDKRKMPDEFDKHAKNAWEAIRYLDEAAANDDLELISLDHDLGDEDEGTGYDVACHIEQCAIEGKMKEFEIRIHTQNPVGRAKMQIAIKNARRAWFNND